MLPLATAVGRKYISTICRRPNPNPRLPSSRLAGLIHSDDRNGGYSGNTSRALHTSTYGSSQIHIDLSIVHGCRWLPYLLAPPEKLRKGLHTTGMELVNNPPLLPQRPKNLQHLRASDNLFFTIHRHKSSGSCNSGYHKVTFLRLCSLFDMNEQPVSIQA